MQVINLECRMMPLFFFFFLHLPVSLFYHCLLFNFTMACICLSFFTLPLVNYAQSTCLHQALFLQCVRCWPLHFLFSSHLIPIVSRHSLMYLSLYLSFIPCEFVSCCFVCSICILALLNFLFSLVCGSWSPTLQVSLLFCILYFQVSKAPPF